MGVRQREKARGTTGETVLTAGMTSIKILVIRRALATDLVIHPIRDGTMIAIILRGTIKGTRVPTLPIGTIGTKTGTMGGTTIGKILEAMETTKAVEVGKQLQRRLRG